MRKTAYFTLDTAEPLEETSTLGVFSDTYRPVLVDCREQTHLTFNPESPFAVIGKSVTRRFFYTGKDHDTEQLIFTDLARLVQDPDERSEQFLQCVDFIPIEELAKYGLAHLKDFVK